MDTVIDNINIQEITGATPAEQQVEIVERKGIGHPDTICDLVMERICQALCENYARHCGRILHHNCDKALLVAGQSARRFGGGTVIEPMKLFIGDRATLVREFDAIEVAADAAKNWFRENLAGLDPQRHLRVSVEFKDGSEPLAGIFREPGPVLMANDTSAAVGYAPLTETERIVLDAEKFLNSVKFKTQFPASGSDVKIMANRVGTELSLTVAMPLVDKYLANENEYFQHKEEMRLALLSYLRSRRDKLQEVTVTMNALDRQDAGVDGLYLTVLGTSAEDADSGAVGRGNRVNGLIALNRPRGSEAAAGKNPMSHVGKIYDVLTNLLARRLHNEVSGLREVMVWLCSRIGDPVDKPRVVSVQVRLAGHTRLGDVVDPIRRIVTRELQRMPSFCEELARRKFMIC